MTVGGVLHANEAEIHPFRSKLSRLIHADAAEREAKRKDDTLSRKLANSRLRFVLGSRIESRTADQFGQHP
jgi:hypothetical protein